MNTGLLSNPEAMKTASTQTETVGLLDLQAKNPTATWIDRVLRPDKSSQRVIHGTPFENIKTGNAVLWNGDIQSAVEFTKNYKTEEFKQYHMPRSGMLVR